MSSGFRYKVYVSESKERGRGIYTKDFIPENSLVWTLTQSNHKSYTEQTIIKHLETLQTPEEKKYFLNHIYIWQNKAILCTDSAELVNHSATPNLKELLIADQGQGCWSVRDIYPGEELLDSYKAYETPEWYLELCRQYNVESSLDVAEKYE